MYCFVNTLRSHSVYFTLPEVLPEMHLLPLNVGMSRLLVDFQIFLQGFAVARW